MANLPAIIEAGSKSPLAILALCICILAILALVFFRTATERTRVVIFLVILLSFVASLSIAYADWRNRREAPAHIDRTGPVEGNSLQPEPVATEEPPRKNVTEVRGTDTSDGTSPSRIPTPPARGDPISPASTESRQDAYDLAEQRVLREARLTGSTKPIEISVRPGEWNLIDTVDEYDPQGCGTTALSVRLVNRPLHGEFRTEPTSVRYSIEEECQMVSGPSTAVYYRPKPGYWGKDIFSYITPRLDRTTIVRTKGVGTQ